VGEVVSVTGSGVGQVFQSIGRLFQQLRKEFAPIIEDNCSFISFSRHTTFISMADGFYNLFRSAKKNAAANLQKTYPQKETFKKISQAKFLKCLIKWSSTKILRK